MWFNMIVENRAHQFRPAICKDCVIMPTPSFPVLVQVALIGHCKQVTPHEKNAPAIAMRFANQTQLRLAAGDKMKRLCRAST